MAGLVAIAHTNSMAAAVLRKETGVIESIEFQKARARFNA
jgi:hypothetical protein